MMKLFEKLNNPIAVVLILATMLAVNGYILYQQRSNPPEANTPSQTETPAVPSETGPERDPQPADEDAEGAKGDDSSQTENAKGDENAGEADNTNADENAKGDESSNNGSSNNGSSNNGSSGEESPDGGPSGDAPQSRENGSNGSGGESGGDEPSSEESEADSDGPDGDSGGGSRNGSGSEESGDGGSRGGQEGGGGREDEGSGEEGGQAPLAGLGEALNGCEGDREGCVRDFVSRVSPDSRYIGGRMDLASGGSGRNAEVLYFEDPGMEACQYERESHEADDLDYTVILVGPGSFNDERGDECIPTT